MNKTAKNYFLSKYLITAYAKLGVNHAFISPGSRNTPLMLALSDQKKIKTHHIIDERSSGYISLGLSKAEKKPSLVVTTSGTAVSNLFPSIVEAYMSCTPMIILTADRPKRMIRTGANQTINQHNIFKNYTIDFIDFSNIKNINENKVISLALDTYKDSMGFNNKNKGPIHINLPFDEPLHISNRDKVNLDNKKFLKLELKKGKIIQKKSTLPDLKKISKPLIICTDVKEHKIVSLAEKYNIPIFMECRGLRFSKKSKNIISMYHFIVQYCDLKPDLIIRLGKKPISNAMNRFLDKNRKITYLIEENEVFNDDAKNIIVYDIDTLNKTFNREKVKIDIFWLKSLFHKEKTIKNYMDLFFKKPKHHEGYIINQIISYLPSESNLMVGNSSPIRNLDNFTYNNSLNINVYSNRGASGIDGIISTSIGMSLASKKNNFLIIGDISFFYDVSSLINHHHMPLNLTIFILNNNGGHIFDRLKGLASEKEYKNYWLTPVNLSIKNIAKAFKCEYFKMNFSSYKNIKSFIKNSTNLKGIKLIEIMVDANKNNKVNASITKNIENLLN